ncbi:hypothetical protein [Kutzneria sp. CA-103260]|uniref:hypothetical protein n=1 Tax=Kutzneria sp. CA-103260 TaxID=2802641 RepID=UPI001BA72D99|nr:hypothetical protein [Kutzneria sp. CA-103260]QUQ65627.1 hypothetical protein JJ691_33510 [Kutzneria sp. CA-103260]
MDGSIAELSCEYLTRGVAATAAAGRLDTVARLELPALLGTMLDAVYGDAETVWVLRDVRAEFALRADSPDAARHWAAALATAVVTAVAEDPGDGVNLVQFDDEADYVARYLADHVRGEAARHWYFRAFEPWHERPSGEAVLGLLLDRPMMPVLAALCRHERLLEVLNAVSDDELAELVARATVVPSAGDDVSGLWPLIVAAVHVADTWSLWAADPMSTVDVARVWRSRPVPDWRSPAALTVVVVDILRYLTGRGELLRPSGPPPAELRAHFDWLDLPLLASGLTVGIVANGRERVISDAVQEMLAGTQWLRAAVLTAGPGPRAALLVRAALAAERPEWTDDRLVESVVARLTGTGALDREPVEFEESPCAGLLLLLRAVADLRLPAVLARAGQSDALPAALLAVASWLTGASPDDPAVRAFAGLRTTAPHEELAWTAVECDAVRAELVAAVQAQRMDELDPCEDVVELMAVAVLRAWARWLGRFAASSTGYLLANFVQRPGRIRWTDREITVELVPRPLDVVVTMAGYDRPLEAVSWLGGRTVTYRMDFS